MTTGSSATPYCETTGNQMIVTRVFMVPPLLLDGVPSRANRLDRAGPENPVYRDPGAPHDIVLVRGGCAPHDVFVAAEHAPYHATLPRSPDHTLTVAAAAVHAP